MILFRMKHGISSFDIDYVNNQKWQLHIIEVLGKQKIQNLQILIKDLEKIEEFNAVEYLKVSL